MLLLHILLKNTIYKIQGEYKSIECEAWISLISDFKISI